MGGGGGGGEGGLFGSGRKQNISLAGARGRSRENCGNLHLFSRTDLRETVSALFKFCWFSLFWEDSFFSKHSWI